MMTNHFLRQCSLLVAMVLPTITSASFFSYDTTTPIVTYCYYSYQDNADKRIFGNYTQDYVETDQELAQIIKSGKWIKHKSKDSFEIQSMESAEYLMNYCSNHIIKNAPKKHFNPRFESIRVATRRYLNNVLTANLVQIGYPVRVNNTDNKLVRVSSKLKAKQEEASLSQSILLTTALNRPYIKQQIDGFDAKVVLETIVMKYGVHKIAKDAGDTAAHYVERMLYEDPNLCIRNASDNSIRKDIYVASKHADKANRFLANIGIDLDAMFNVHPSVNWLLNIVKHKIQTSVATLVSQSVGQGIQHLVSTLTEKALKKIINESVESAKRFFVQPNKDQEIEAILTELDIEIDKNLEQILVDENREIQSIIQEQLPQDVDQKLAIQVAEAVIQEIGDLHKDHLIQLNKGGLNKINHMRYHETNHKNLDDEIITLKSVTRAILAEIKIKIHTKIHGFIRTAIHESLVSAAQSVTKKTVEGGGAISLMMTPILGPNAAFIGGGLALANMATDQRFTNYIGEKIGSSIGDKISQTTDNTNLPLPSFLKITNDELELIAASYKTDDFYFMETVEQSENTWTLNAYNIKSPTVKNYLIQESNRFKNSVKSAHQVIKDAGNVVKDAANNAAHQTMDALQEATEVITGNTVGFYRWFISKVRIF